MCHPGLLKFVVKGSAGILESSVTVKQGMSIRICFHCFVKGFIHEWVVIMLTQYIGHNTPVTEIQDRAQIELVYRGPLIPFELGYISKPLLVWPVRMELAVQKIFGNILRIFGPPGTATGLVFHSRAYIPGPADTQHTLIINMDTIVVAQIVIKPPVTFVRVLQMDFFNLIRQSLVFLSPAAQVPRGPFMVSRTSNMEQTASRFNRIPL